MADWPDHECEGIGNQTGTDKKQKIHFCEPLNNGTIRSHNIDEVTAVDRLTEIVAMVGFTRLQAWDGKMDSLSLASIFSNDPKTWLGFPPKLLSQLALGITTP